MNKKIIIGLVIGFGLLTVLVLASLNPPKSEAITGNQGQSQSQESASRERSAEKIEVVHFHGTQQCVSCITVGKFALETIKNKFPNEYASGKIIFRDINGELPENAALVMKFQARGSSLFVNAIVGGKDNIEEDTTVWRLISDENQYVSYFQNKLKNLLGK